MADTAIRDYSLTGPASEQAVEKGLAEAEWYQCPVPRDEMRRLLQRRDGPALLDTLLWFALLGIFGLLGFLLWNSIWAIFPFLAYSVIYASSSDSRWHETSHGTAFKTDWLNNALYEIASFMVMRESTLWRWSHTRHHSDTLIVGRDPEIAVPRPVNLRQTLMGFTGIPQIRTYFGQIFRHSLGRISEDEKSYLPEDQYRRLIWTARAHLAVYLAAAALSLHFRTILPFMYVGIPNLLGTWLMPIYGYTQHAGLAENVLDHRLNCRTVYMNRINRYLYWNMNYHIEHHMFPLVPYHNLPRLHALVKHDMPRPYRSIAEAYKEIVPAVIRQSEDPEYYVQRELPSPSKSHPEGTAIHRARGEQDGWLVVCPGSELDKEDVLRFDHHNRSFLICRSADGSLHAADGYCTHGRSHLAEGFVRGHLLECAKHNGRFDVRDGSPQRAPVCVGLQTYPVKESEGRILIDIREAGGSGANLIEQTHRFEVASSRNVATFIRELELKPLEPEKFSFRPGDYIQLDIPRYEHIDFRDFDIQQPFKEVWEAEDIYRFSSENPEATRRNFSLASNPDLGELPRFNIRISLPPEGESLPAGVGSSYAWQLKPGDEVSAIGPFGDFHIQDSDREMVYIGGGSGMAPLRAHISHLFETQGTSRNVSYWYGARSRREIFYRDYFEDIAQRFDNFDFHIALSSPLPEDDWQGPTGYIHEVVESQHLNKHPDPAAIEYYLCGPPPMIQALRRLLDRHGVPESQIAFDEFD